MNDRPVDPSRRRFLVRGLGGVAAIGFGGWALRGITVWLSDVDRGAELRSLIHDGDTASALGRRYLALAPREADEGRLIALLTDRRSARPVRQQVSLRMEEDFAARRTVTLDGWVVSRSEARLFALAAIG